MKKNILFALSAILAAMTASALEVSDTTVAVTKISDTTVAVTKISDTTVTTSSAASVFTRRQNVPTIPYTLKTYDPVCWSEDQYGSILLTIEKHFADDEPLEHFKFYLFNHGSLETKIVTPYYYKATSSSSSAIFDFSLLRPETYTLFVSYYFSEFFFSQQGEVILNFTIYPKPKVEIPIIEKNIAGMEFFDGAWRQGKDGFLVFNRDSIKNGHPPYRIYCDGADLEPDQDTFFVKKPDYISIAVWDSKNCYYSKGGDIVMSPDTLHIGISLDKSLSNADSSDAHISIVQYNTPEALWVEWYKNDILIKSGSEDFISDADTGEYYAIGYGQRTGLVSSDRIKITIDTTIPPVTPPIDTVTPPIVPPIDTITPPIDTVTPPIVPPIDTIAPPIDTVTPPIVPPIDTIAPPIDTVTPPIVPPIDTIAPPIDTVTPPIVPPIDTIAPPIDTVTPPIIPPIDTIAPPIDTVTPPIIPPIDTIAPPIDTVTPPIVPPIDTIAPPIDTVTPPIIPPIDTIAPPIDTVTPPIIPPIDTVIPPIIIPPIDTIAPPADTLPPCDSSITACLWICSEFIWHDIGIAVNVSPTRFDSILWSFPPSAELRYEDYNELELQFNDTGIFDIGMTGYYNDCISKKEVQIIVSPPPQKHQQNSQSSSSIIRYASVYPQPVTENSVLEIETIQDASVSIKIYNIITGLQSTHSNFSVNANEKIFVPINISSGKYVLQITTTSANGKSSIKTIKIISL
ncbi:MAG: hypothetical protein LBQ31_01920 [Bacteroidales bacterium]|jgi:hypothetical protein|nr:hypothetical protein [Bacteroidales bacterium]